VFGSPTGNGGSEPPNGSAFSGQQQRCPSPIRLQKYDARRQPRSIELSC
jgi:hypothetical protein